MSHLKHCGVVIKYRKYVFLLAKCEGDRKWEIDKWRGAVSCARVR